MLDGRADVSPLGKYYGDAPIREITLLDRVLQELDAAFDEVNAMPISKTRRKLLIRNLVNGRIAEFIREGSDRGR